ncbi:Zinc finger protein 135-like Protein [Tribolium castaneum]|uniref:Zinc finger protein 135-like Protein n=1 Tax=Tribolium castaneum TaxID=7070 RepID=A0A139WJX7_TRICA|nr:Zinc finger protein 135-like Protein [Tribolium castaneum]
MVKTARTRRSGQVKKRKYPFSVYKNDFQDSDFVPSSEDSGDDHTFTRLTKKANKKPVLCDICGTHISSNYELKRHIRRRHKGEKLFVCSKCGKRFAVKDDLVIHERAHSGDRRHECDICGKKFTQRTPLVVHKRLHTGERPYECHLCDKKYVAKGQRKRKFKNERKSSDSSDSDFVPSSDVSSDDHTYSKAPPKKKPKLPVLCDICGKHISTNDHLKRHMKTHTGEKRFVCYTCGKRFALRTTLEEHERIHTGDKRYECDLCGRKFTQRTPLVTHKRSHTGEKPYNCHLCDKKFRSKAQLTLHLKNHPA